MNGVYWGLTTLDLLGKLDTLDSNEVIEWIMECQHDSGLSKNLTSSITSLVYVLFPGSYVT